NTAVLPVLPCLLSKSKSPAASNTKAPPWMLAPAGIFPELPRSAAAQALPSHLLRFAAEQNKNTYGAWAREAWARKHVENGEEAGCRLVCRDPPALGCRKRGFGGGGAGKPHSAGKCHGRKRQQSDPGRKPRRRPGNSSHPGRSAGGQSAPRHVGF